MTNQTEPRRRGRPPKSSYAAQTENCLSCVNYDSSANFCAHFNGQVDDPTTGCPQWANSALPLPGATRKSGMGMLADRAVAGVGTPEMRSAYQRATGSQVAELTEKPAARNVAQAVGEAVSEQAERDIANRLLGGIKKAQGIAKLLTVSNLIDLQKIKESKGYKHLTATGLDGKLLTVSTWEEFCGLLGVSRQQVDLDLQNIKALGAEALESMQRAGLGYRELRKLRQLDSADRTIVIEAMGQRIEEDAGDKEAIKEAFAEMLETVQKRADKRVAELERGLDSMTREQSASNKVLADKEKKIRELHSALEATQEKPISPDQKVAAWAKQISDISDNAQYASTSSLGAIQILFKRIADEYERGNAPIPRPLQQAMGTAVQRLRAGVEALAEEFQLWGAMDEVLNAGSGGDDAWLQNQNGGLN